MVHVYSFSIKPSTILDLTSLSTLGLISSSMVCLTSASTSGLISVLIFCLAERSASCWRVAALCAVLLRTSLSRFASSLLSRARRFSFSVRRSLHSLSREALQAQAPQLEPSQLGILFPP